MNSVFSPPPASSCLILPWLSFIWVTESFLLQAQKGSSVPLFLVLGRFGVDMLGGKFFMRIMMQPRNRSPEERGPPSLEGFTSGFDRAMARLVPCWRWPCFDVRLQWQHKSWDTVLRTRMEVRLVWVLPDFRKNWVLKSWMGSWTHPKTLRSEPRRWATGWVHLGFDLPFNFNLALCFKSFFVVAIMD